MSNTVTQRLNLIKPTPGTNDPADISELNTNADLIDAWLIPAAKIRKAAGTQSIATATTTSVDYDSVTYDTWAAESEGAMANITANNITARINGLYHVEAGICIATNATGFRALGVAVNGVITPYQLRTFMDSTDGGLATIVQISGDIPLSAGDALHCAVLHNAGSSLNLDQSDATATDAIYLSATWVGKKP